MGEAVYPTPPRRRRDEGPSRHCCHRQLPQEGTARSRMIPERRPGGHRKNGRVTPRARSCAVRGGAVRICSTGFLSQRGRDSCIFRWERMSNFEQGEEGSFHEFLAVLSKLSCSSGNESTRRDRVERPWHKVIRFVETDP